jgi:hypothetical protein
MRKLTVQYGSHGIGMLGRHVTSRLGRRWDCREGDWLGLE